MRYLRDSTKAKEQNHKHICSKLLNSERDLREANAKINEATLKLQTQKEKNDFIYKKLQLKSSEEIKLLYHSLSQSKQKERYAATKFAEIQVMMEEQRRLEKATLDRCKDVFGQVKI